jgi:hypothetical protein
LPGADATAGLNEFDVGSKESPRDDGTEELLGTSTAVTTSAAAAAGDAEPTPPRTPGRDPRTGPATDDESADPDGDVPAEPSEPCRSA